MVLVTIGAYAQEDKAVLKPINMLFEAMKTGDTTAIRKVFHPEAVLFTVVKDQSTGQPGLRKETLKAFLTAVGKPHKDVYKELTWGEKVLIDGDFAQVWADYAFYINTTFHHCGVDAFQMIRGKDGNWLIYGLSDTRRKEGCLVPEQVQKLVK